MQRVKVATYLVFSLFLATLTLIKAWSFPGPNPDQIRRAKHEIQVLASPLKNIPIITIIRDLLFSPG